MDIIVINENCGVLRMDEKKMVNDELKRNDEGIEEKDNETNEATKILDEAMQYELNKTKRKFILNNIIK